MDDAKLEVRIVKRVDLLVLEIDMVFDLHVLLALPPDARNEFIQATMRAAMREIDGRDQASH